MPLFEPTGDLLSDMQSAIDNQVVAHITYTDRKGNFSDRNIAPLEIRADSMYAADLAKMALRLFKLDSIGTYEILEDTFVKDELQLG